MNKRYIIDTNIFISSFRFNYPIDLMPSYWNYLLKLFEDNTCIIIDEVYKEIVKNDDELSDWFKSNKKSFDIKSSSEEDVINSYSRIITKVMENTIYTTPAKNVFASCADSWIIAHALAKDYILVTNESKQPDARRRIMIPNVCEEYGIVCLKIHEFLRETGFKV